MTQKRIGIIALGSRGDVQPYVALGKGLQDAGYFVRLVTHESYERFVRSYGLDFLPVKGNVQELMQTEEVRLLLEKGNFLAITSFTVREARRAALHWAEAGLGGCQGLDLLLAGMGGLNVGLALAEKLDVPFMPAYVIPFTPTTAFPGVLFPQALARLGGVVNWWTHLLTRQVMWQGYRRADNQARKQVLGLPAAPFWGPHGANRLRRAPTLYGISPSVVPKPADWGSNIHVTGYWFLEAEPEWTPPSALVDFLHQGPAPVYIGFGSMTQRKPEEAADLILRAVAQTQQRAVILSGWDGFRKQELPDTVFVVDSVPHDWLFAQVTAVVHHGGAGTIAAGLKAGVPSVVIPFFGDQPFWGHRVAALGVGPEPIPRSKLNGEQLAQAIHQAIHDQPMRQRAADLGAKIRGEDGVAEAVAIVRRFEERGGF